MADAQLKGYLTKTQAAKKFNRHKSTITRGINAALRAKDEKVLDLCKVKTADGKIHDGNTVAPEILSQLHNDGLRPVWYLLPEAMDLMIKRDSSAHGGLDEVLPTDSTDAPEEGSGRPVSTPDPASADYVTELEKQLAVARERLSIIEQQNQQLLDDKEYFKEQAKNATELQKEDNIVRGQTNELMKELLGRLRASDKPSLAVVSSGPELVLEGELVGNDQDDSQPAPAPNPAKGRSSGSRTRASKETKQQSPAKKPAASATKNQREPTAAEKYLPTFTRLFSRSKK